MPANVPTKQTWLPLALRRRSLIAFSLFFAVLSIGLGAIYWISKKHDGLAVPILKYRYFWTYSPTILFIITSGVWSLVDHYSRCLAPWKAIVSGSIISEKDLSLDYTSTNHYSVFLSSWKRKHWNVTLAAAGTIFLDVLIVLSTGLFIAQPTTISRDHEFTTTTQLNTSRPVPISLGTAFSTSYALAMYGLPYPRGTTREFAYAKLDDKSYPADATSRLVVDAIWSDVVCELGNATLTFGLQGITNTTNGTAGAKVDINASGNCRDTFNQGFVETKVLDKYMLLLSPTKCYADDNTTVLSSKFTVVAGLLKLSNDSVLDAQRALRSATKEGPMGSSGSYFIPIHNRTISSSAHCVFCSINPRPRKARLIRTGDSWLPELIATPDEKASEISIGQDRNYTLDFQWKLYLATTWSLMFDSDYLIGFGQTKPMSQSDKGILPWTGWMAPWFQVMNQTDPRGTIDEMLDEKFLLQSFRSTTQLVASQFVAKNFFQNSTATIVGQLEIIENRLVVSSVALGLTLCLLVGMTIISLVLLPCTRGTTMKDPGSIASKASILVNNVQAVDALHRRSYCGIHAGYPLTTNHDSIADYHHGEKDGSVVGFQDVGECGCESLPFEQRSNDVDWWTPWSSSFSCRLLAVFSPLALIATLEALRKWSDHAHGIIDVPRYTFVHHLWVYLPVVVVVLLAAIFTATSITDRIIQPYVVLRNKPCSPSQALEVDLVNRTSVSALCFALRLKHFGTAAAIFATLLGAALPIAVSGLYFTQDHYRSQDATVRKSSGFNSSVNIGSLNSTKDFYPVPGFVVYQNLSFPQWTYGKYALPSFTLEQRTVSGNDGLPFNSTLNVEVPAIYGVANCSVLPKDRVTLVAKPPVDNFNGMSIYAELKMTPECPRASLFVVNANPLSTKLVVAAWTGITYNRLFNATLASTQNSRDKTLADFHGDNGIPQGCPGSIAVLGRGTYSNKTGEMNISDSFALACSPYVAQEKLNTTFSVPELQISAAQAPLPVAGTQTIFSEAELLNNWGFTVFLPDDKRTIIDPKVPELAADRFFKAVFAGADGILPSDIVNADNKTFKQDDVTMQRIKDRMERVYGYTVAQIYGVKKRITASDLSGSADTWDATVTFPVGTRIVQDHTSTRISQGILAVMTVCAIISMIMIDGKRILPKNPCSIGTIAALLKNSSLLNDGILPPEAELMDEKQIKERGFLEHHMFSLGWWGSGDKAWYGIDIGKADREK